jgi:hypothetical protein
MKSEITFNSLPLIELKEVLIEMTADRSLKIIFGDRKLCDFWHITWKEFSI